MNWNHWIRQAHHLLSMAFTVTVVANILVIASGQRKAPPPWVTYSPRIPLALLTLSGQYLFVRPQDAQWRGGRSAKE